MTDMRKVSVAEVAKAVSVVMGVSMTHDIATVTQAIETGMVSPANHDWVQKVFTEIIRAQTL